MVLSEPVPSGKAWKIIPAIEPDAFLQFGEFQAVPLNRLTPRREEVRSPQRRDDVRVLFRTHQLKLHEPSALVQRVKIPDVVLLEEPLEWEDAGSHRSHQRAALAVATRE